MAHYAMVSRELLYAKQSPMDSEDNGQPMHQDMVQLNSQRKQMPEVVKVRNLQ